MKLTDAQIKALRMVSKRDWPAGEPRERWFNVSSLAVLERKALVAFGAERSKWSGRIVYLTEAGRAALQQEPKP